MFEKFITDCIGGISKAMIDTSATSSQTIRQILNDLHAALHDIRLAEGDTTDNYLETIEEYITRVLMDSGESNSTTLKELIRDKYPKDQPIVDRIQRIIVMK